MSSETPRPPTRFTHLTLKNWRNFVHVSVDLERRVVLVGPNAAGKSNFLDAFRFLHDIAAVGGGGFQQAVTQRGGVSRVRSLSARKFPDVVVSVSAGTDDDPDRWEYELAFSQDNNRRPIVKREYVKYGGQLILDRPNSDDAADPQRLTQTYLEQVNVNRDFRSLADLFRSVKYLHLVPHLVREPLRSAGKVNDPYGGDFLEQVGQASTKTRTARLKRIRDALRVAVPQLSELEWKRDEHGTAHLRGKYEHWRPQGAWQEEADFSDGTLRLIGLLWALLDGKGPLLLEEPELSLHPEVIRFLPTAFVKIQRKHGRQIILSTHSASLLDDPGLGLDEVLMLVPNTEGTTIDRPEEMPDVVTLLDKGMSLADIVIPRTRPKNTYQWALFGD